MHGCVWRNHLGTARLLLRYNSNRIRAFECFSGESGSFNIKVGGLPTHIIGNYSISGQNLHVVITKKPGLASCKRIEDYLNGAIPHSALGMPAE